MTYTYNTTEIGSADVAGVQAAYEEIGTYLGSYTPDVFKIKGLSLGVGRSNSDVGFSVFSVSDGNQEYFDLLDPVYVSEQVYFEAGRYDLIQLVIPMDVSQDTLVDDSEPPGTTSR